MIEQQRKIDTRRKIQIGGLAIKANIDNLFDEDKSTKRMLGAFVYLRQLLDNDEHNILLNKFDKLGANEFEG